MDKPQQEGANQVNARHPAKPGSKEIEIYQRIQAAIADNRLPPGTKLGEENLAKFLKVSRARIREVLRDLSRERLVTILPNRGAFVATPTIDDTRQIYQARRIIEGALIRRVTERITNNQIEELEAKVSDEKHAWARDDREQAIRYSREFHLRLVELGGNEILSDTMRSTLSLSSLAAALYGERHNPGCMCQDHADILEAIRRRNGAEAEKLMTNHLQQVEDRMRLLEDPVEVSIEDALSYTQ